MRQGKWKKKKGQLKIWLKTHRRSIRRWLMITAALIVLFYGACVALSYRAADIFNNVVAERVLFPGSVTVERLSATPTGKVTFSGLVWKDEEGNVLADIPNGYFKVNPWDVVMRRIGTTTLTELNIEDGYVHLVFNKDMELQNIKGISGNTATKKDKKTGEKKRRPLQITGLDGNKKFNCVVNIHKGKIEADAPNRHFIIDHVELKSDIHTGGKSKIDLMAGGFSGTIEATGLQLNGTLDFTKKLPEYNMYLVIRECNPKSLNVGVDINNPATVNASITGSLPSPIFDGMLTLDELDITALNFTNVRGHFHYEDGKLDADRVTADVFDGKVDASGSFDLDEKSYHADIVGKKLKGGAAAHDPFFRCDVDLELHMGEDKLKGTKEIYGKFLSSSGRYHVLPFKKISGRFEQIGKTLLFENVVISVAMGDVTTDAFSIVDGKVHLGTIYVDNAGKRQKLR